MYIIILIALIIFILKVRQWENRPGQHQQADTVTNFNYDLDYVPRRLLTNNEKSNYRRLKEITDREGLLICPKVRLLDLVEPRSGAKGWKALLAKVQSKHVDFVICDQEMNVKVILELDDVTHERPDRIERDKFVDTVLTRCGYQIIHTKYISDTTLDPILAPKFDPRIKIEHNGPTFEEWKTQRELEKTSHEA